MRPPAHSITQSLNTNEFQKSRVRRRRSSISRINEAARPVSLLDQTALCQSLLTSIVKEINEGHQLNTSLRVDIKMITFRSHCAGAPANRNLISRLAEKPANGWQSQERAELAKRPGTPGRIKALATKPIMKVHATSANNAESVKINVAWLFWT